MSHRGTLSLGVLSLLLTLTFARAGSAQGQTNLFGAGIERYQAGDYVAAQRLLREYVEAYADKGGSEAAHLSEAYHYLGLMTPDAKLAEGYFLAVAQRYPSSPIADESFARLGYLYASLGNFSEARSHWRTLARDYPLSRLVPEVDLRVGQTYFAERNWEQAYEVFLAGFSKMKNYKRASGQGANLRELEGEYVYWLGRTLMERDAFDDARKYLNLILLDYPNHPLEPLALYHLSKGYRDKGDEKKADEAWRRFSESVRNTSLEPLAANPNLIEIAQARESGALRPRGEREEALAQDEAGAPSDERAGGLPMPADRGEGAKVRPGQDARAAAGEGAGGAGAAGKREEVARDVGAPAMRGGPAENEGLRAPEPGRPGGAVTPGPAGRPVEEPQAERERQGPQAEPAQREQPEPKPEREQPKPQPERQVQEPQPLGRPDEERAVAQAPPAGEAQPEQAAAADQASEAKRAQEAQALQRGQEIMAGEPVVAPTGESLPTGIVYLQVGAFTSAESAAKLSTSLKRNGFEPILHPGLVNGQGYYRVRIGPYDLPRDNSVLETQRAALMKAGFESIVKEQEPPE